MSAIPTQAELLLRLANRVHRVHALEDGLLDILESCQEASVGVDADVVLKEDIIPAIIRLVHPMRDEELKDALDKSGIN